MIFFRSLLHELKTQIGTLKLHESQFSLLQVLLNAWLEQRMNQFIRSHAGARFVALHHFACHNPAFKVLRGCTDSFLASLS